MNAKKISVSLLILFLLAISVRLGISLYLEKRIYFHDAVYHDRIAENIVRGNGAIASSNSVALRMPGYPYILSFFKNYSRGQEDYIVKVRLFQSFISALIVIPVFLILIRIVSPRLAWVGALLLVFNPLQSVMSAFLLTEVMYSFALTMFIYSIILLTHQKHSHFFILSALSLLIGVYMRESMFHIIVFFVILSISLKAFHSYRKIFIALCIITICGLIPWVMRNHAKLNTFVPFTTNEGFTLYDSLNPWADGGTDVTKFLPQEKPEGLSEVEVNTYWKKKSFNEIRKDPLRIAYLAAKKFRKFWSITPNANEFKTRKLLLIFRIFYIPLFIFLCVGLFSFVTRRSLKLSIVSIPILYSLLLHLMINGSLRYRMPLEPFIIIIAVCGIETILNIKNKVFSK
ncbi:hypothetical protein ACFL3D_02805 [Candidatus Omnitrophota bacterium]